MEVYYDIDGSMFVIDYTPHENGVSIDFVCRQIGGYDADGPVYIEEGDFREKADAPVYLRGHVKWDGCTNYDFPGSRDCMLHECGRSGLVALGVLLGRIHDQCAALMPGKVHGDIGAHPVVVDVMPWAKGGT